MKIKNEKLQLSKVLADVSLKIGKISADSACAYIFHQPKMPAELKNLRENKHEIFIGKDYGLYY